MIKIKKILKQITLKRLILLIFLLMFNSYAWFIYATKVKNSISTRVVAWDVAFESKQEEVVNTLEIDIERIYPGMPDFEQIVDATNLGEIDAVLTFAIREVSIFGEIFSVESGLYTPDDLLEMMQDGTYPFYLDISVDSDGTMTAEGGTCNLTIKLMWEFELDTDNYENETNEVIEAKIKEKDDLDTLYGELAYEYHAEYPDLPSIILKIDIIATQIK